MNKMTPTKFRGHPIVKRGGAYYFVDNGDPVAETWRQRPCGHCGEYNTPEGYDACLGYVKGVMNACCGHGNVDEAYIQTWDGRVIQGQEALVWGNNTLADVGDVLKYQEKGR